MVLVNGSEGIGTGWSTYVPNYNPRDIVANIMRLLKNEPMVPMDPWYKGFRVRMRMLYACRTESRKIVHVKFVFCELYHSYKSSG